MSPQMRHDFMAQRAKIPRISEHFTDLHRQKAEKLRQHIPLLQQALQLGIAPASEMFARLCQAAGQRRPGVATKIIFTDSVQLIE